MNATKPEEKIKSQFEKTTTSISDTFEIASIESAQIKSSVSSGDSISITLLESTKKRGRPKKNIIDPAPAPTLTTSNSNKDSNKDVPLRHYDFGLKAGDKCICPVCGKEFIVNPYDTHYIIRRHYTCGWDCMWNYMHNKKLE